MWIADGWNDYEVLDTSAGENIKKFGVHRAKFNCLYHAPDAYLCDIRDSYDSLLESIITDDDEIFNRIMEFAKIYQPEDIKKIKRWDNADGKLDAVYDVTKTLEHALMPKVWLKNGGYLVIQPTEALVSIDVNTGKAISKKKDVQKTFLKVNLEAATQIAGEAGLNEILLMDVTPLSLSIETAGGVATRLIDRNSTIPTRYSQIFTTAANFQTTVEIKVLQGERAMARDNQVLGTFKLKGIKRAMRGVPQIEVTFDIDVNGILNVSAKDLATGKEQSITITASSNMSDKDIERAMEDAKAYESEDQEKRDAIGSYNEGENMLYKGEAYLAQHKKELSREQRSELKSAISDLKHSMKRIKPQNITEEQGRAIKEASERLNQLIR